MEPTGIEPVLLGAKPFSGNHSLAPSKVKTPFIGIIPDKGCFIHYLTGFQTASFHTILSVLYHFKAFKKEKY